jgi:hypothetical protein
MTDLERQMVTSLCARISEEKDAVVFTQLVYELDALLEELEQSSGRAYGGSRQEHGNMNPNQTLASAPFQQDVRLHPDIEPQKTRFRSRVK